MRLARKSKGLTQAELGKLAGMPAHRISLVETSSSDPKVSTLFALISALELDLELLQRGQGQRSIDDVADIF